MEKITISSQAEYDALPEDYNGRIIVKGDVDILVRGSAIVEVYDSATVSAYGSLIIFAYDSSRIFAFGFSKVMAYNSSQIRAYNHSIVTLYSSSVATAFDYSTVKAYDTSFIKAFDSATVSSYDLSVVTTYSEGAISAYGSSQVINLNHNKITLSGLAREVTLPENIEEYSNWYNIPIIDGKIKLYKAVHKDADGYYSNYDPNFRYSIRAEYEIDCDKDTNDECGYGLHASRLDWAIDYGHDWSNAAILEVEIPVECIVVPKNGNGKIRTSKLKVLREVPKEEW